jgi:simple sugar transport system permease protein
MLIFMALAAMVMGGAWIGLSGWMRQRRGVNETISSLLLSYIAIALFRQLVEGPLRDPASLNKPSTMPLDDTYTIGNISDAFEVHWGLAPAPSPVFWPGYCCAIAWPVSRWALWG